MALGLCAFRFGYEWYFARDNMVFTASNSMIMSAFGWVCVAICTIHSLVLNVAGDGCYNATSNGRQHAALAALCTILDVFCVLRAATTSSDA